MATTTEALVGRLVSEAVTTAARIFVGNGAHLPGDGAFVTVQATGGLEPWGTHDGGATKYRRPMFQLVARAKRFADAERLASDAYDALDFSNLTVSGVAFLRVRPLQEPFELPLDTAGRCRVAFNVIAEHARA